MKFTVQKSELMRMLTPAMGTVSNKNTITSIEGVLLETLDDGRLQISTYDMNKGFRATLDTVSVERDGRFIINAQRLYQTVRVLPDEDITFDINDKLACEITAGKASFSMFALNGQDFPNLPDLVTERGFTISADVLKKMITKVMSSVAESDTRPMLCGAFMKITPDVLEIVSCDSYRLSKCRMTCDLGSLAPDGNLNYSFILPGHALAELTKILSEGDEESCRFYISKKHAIINKGDIIFFTRLIESEYIDYNRIIPRDNGISVTVDRERLLSGLERANIIAEEKIQGSGRSYVKLTVEGHYVNLASTSVNGGVSDEMDCVHEGDDINIGFNCRYLIDAVKAAEGEQIIVKLKSANQAITIEPAERDEAFDYLYMVLPVRMNDAN